MRKNLAVLLVLVLLGSSLSGCSRQSAAAKVEGYGGNIELKAVRLEDNTFSLSVVEQTENFGLGALAVDGMINRINTRQSLSVDAIAGATVTSQATLECAERALVKLGYDVATLRSGDFFSIKQSFAYDADVVVLGAGGAGITAAIAAAKAGMKVIVLEKQGVAGGSTVRSDGLVAASGSYLQARYRINDTAINFASHLFAHSDRDMGSFRQLELAEHSGANIDMLREMGVQFSETLYTDVDSETPRNLLPANGEVSGGSVLVVPLYNQSRSLGVEYIYNTRAEEIIIDVTGKIEGVRGRDTDGNRVTVYAPAVIIATGGFDHSEMLRQELTGITPRLSVSGPGSTGDGINIARRAGAEIYANGSLMASLEDLGTGMFNHGGLIVTPDGNRFCNETEDGFSKGGLLMEQGFSSAWQILDGQALAAARKNGLLAESYIAAESLDALTAALHTQNLVAEVEHYNQLCLARADSDYNKTVSDLIPLTGGPYAAIPLTLRSYGSIGGIVTNSKCQVIGTSQRPISGLFAAGEVCNGAYFSSFPGFGSSLAVVVDTGRCAGESAAEMVQLMQQPAA